MNWLHNTHDAYDWSSTLILNGTVFKFAPRSVRSRPPPEKVVVVENRRPTDDDTTTTIGSGGSMGTGSRILLYVCKLIRRTVDDDRGGEKETLTIISISGLLIEITCTQMRGVVRARSNAPQIINIFLLRSSSTISNGPSAITLYRIT